MSEQVAKAKAKANAGEGANGEGQRTDRTGFLQGLGCYLLWGVMPVYWKLLSAIPAFEVLAWRMVWSCAAVVALCVLVIGVIGLIIDKGLTRLEHYYLAKTRGIIDSK